MLYQIPLLALVLLNLIVIFYVIRERGRSNSGFFLLVNALALILWAGGFEMWRASGRTPIVLALPSTAVQLIAASIFLYCASRLEGGSPVWNRPWMMPLVFLPGILGGLLSDFSTESLVRRTTPLLFGDWGDFLTVDGGIPMLTIVVYLVGSIAVLSRRFTASPPGPSRNLPRHLILAICAPVLFAYMFAAVTSMGYFPMIPSLSLVVAIIAQLGLLVVIRQEETERPLYLSRWIFYAIALLVGFFISHLLFTLYESFTANVLLVPQLRLMVLATIAVVLMMASIPAIQNFFDRLLFRRAWEYRQLVREAQLELHETRERLRRAERLSVVGEMAARIAHEIKNPLGPIKGYAQMMTEKLEGMEDFPHQKSFLRQLKVIGEEVETIDRKVRQLLDLSRKPEVIVAPENINQIVERAATLIRLEAEAFRTADAGPQVIVVEDLDKNLPLVSCSRTRIEEAVFNLCRNAFEASEHGDTVVLRTRAEKSPTGIPGVKIMIEDQGPGFSDSARTHLFEPFYTEKSGGTGLGLSIVKGHIDLHGGHVDFGTGKRGGTVAAIWLPLEGAINQSVQRVHAVDETMDERLQERVKVST